MASQSIEHWLNNELLKTRVQLEYLGTKLTKQFIEGYLQNVPGDLTFDDFRNLVKISVGFKNDEKLQILKDKGLSAVELEIYRGRVASFQRALAQLPNAQREAIIGEFWFGRKPDPKLRREALRALRHPRIRKPLMEYYG